jgi:hypothetical protein
MAHYSEFIYLLHLNHHLRCHHISPIIQVSLNAFLVHASHLIWQQIGKDHTIILDRQKGEPHRYYARSQYNTERCEEPYRV